MAGYSGTPLVKKLGIKSGTVILTLGAPEDYRDWLDPLPENVSFVAKSPKSGCDVVHQFAVSRAAFERDLPKARKSLAPDGALWVSWIKKSAKIPTDLTEDVIRTVALKTDLVDVKVCAVTEIWSGLKLVVRKHLR
jgi:hypothetical protein